MPAAALAARDAMELVVHRPEQPVRRVRIAAAAYGLEDTCDVDRVLHGAVRGHEEGPAHTFGAAARRDRARNQRHAGDGSPHWNIELPGSVRDRAMLEGTGLPGADPARAAAPSPCAPRPNPDA